MMNKKKQGDPKRVPRSPWGLPGRRDNHKPSEEEPLLPRSPGKKVNQPERKLQQLTRLVNSFLLLPRPEGMKELQQEMRSQRQYLGSPEFVNIGRSYPVKCNKKSNGGNGKSSKGFSKHLATERLLRSTLGQ